MNTDLLIQEYLDVLIQAVNTYYAKYYPNLEPDKYYIMKGRKYHRVVSAGKHGNRSVHAFVGEDGMLYKAAGWAAPAKDARYNLATDMDVLRERIDPHGGYLYKR